MIGLTKIRGKRTILTPFLELRDDELLINIMKNNLHTITNRLMGNLPILGNQITDCHLGGKREKNSCISFSAQNWLTLYFSRHLLTFRRFSNIR